MIAALFPNQFRSGTLGPVPFPIPWMKKGRKSGILNRNKCSHFGGDPDERADAAAPFSQTFQNGVEPGGGYALPLVD